MSFWSPHAPGPPRHTLRRAGRPISLQTRILMPELQSLPLLLAVIVVFRLQRRNPHRASCFAVVCVGCVCRAVPLMRRIAHLFPSIQIETESLVLCDHHQPHADRWRVDFEPHSCVATRLGERCFGASPSAPPTFMTATQRWVRISWLPCMSKQ